MRAHPQPSCQRAVGDPALRSPLSPDGSAGSVRACAILCETVRHDEGRAAHEGSERSVRGHRGAELHHDGGQLGMGVRERGRGRCWPGRAAAPPLAWGSCSWRILCSRSRIGGGRGFFMAGTISEEDIQKVREASDLVAVIGERSPVKQRGRDFWCCCPLHNEKTPSFKIDPLHAAVALLRLRRGRGCVLLHHEDGGSVVSRGGSAAGGSSAHRHRRRRRPAGHRRQSQGAPQGGLRRDGRVLPSPAYARPPDPTLRRHAGT